MVAGGKGAPLVPYLDFLLYRHARFGRIVQNIGGIGNLIGDPGRRRCFAGRRLRYRSWQHGDRCADGTKLYSRSYDKDGAVAAKGTPDLEVVRAILREPFFKRKPPKTAGREEFGREFVAASPSFAAG